MEISGVTLKDLKGRGFLFTDQYDTSCDFKTYPKLRIRDGMFVCSAEGDAFLNHHFVVIHAPSIEMPLLGLAYDFNPQGADPDSGELEFFIHREEP